MTAALDTIGRDLSALPRAQYRVIAIDPPTKFIAGTKGRPQHYPRMTDREIAALDLRALAHPDGCFVFLWVTSPKLYRQAGCTTQLRPDELAQAWGARWSGRAFVWVKTLGSDPTRLHFGAGYTTRKNAEDCLLFKFGRPPRVARDVHEIIMAPRREHSRKPEAFYERVERFARGPYLDVFSREARPGWDCAGNEVGKFAPLLAAAE